MEKFISELLKSSQSQVYEEAVKEWKCIDCFYIDDGLTCLCGKHPIHYIMVWGNSITAQKINCGNDCSIEHFFTDYKSEIYRLNNEKKQADNLEKYAKELAQIETIQKLGTDWEKKFSESIKDILLNGWNISQKQQFWWDKIREKHHCPEDMIPITEETIDFAPLIFKDKRKEAVQRQVFAKWQQYGCKGTAEIATGIGKTMIGLMAMQQNPGAKVIIVVPKIDLQEQWIKEMDALHIPEHFIGKVGNGFHEFDKQIVVAVVNSIRDKTLKADLLICDEFHRYGSIENFAFISNGQFGKILGLSATMKRQDNAQNLLYKYAPVIFTFSQKEAIDAGLLTGFELTNMKVSLTAVERDKYLNNNKFIEDNFPTFDKKFENVQSAIYGGSVRGQIAIDLMKAFGTRKAIVANAVNKITEACKIITEEGVPKTLVFCELIKTADAIVKGLKSQGIAAAKYHSKMKGDEKEQMLDDFKDDGRYQVMVAVRSLDEGTNIPDCEMAIFVAGSSVPRQMMQRLGRILRVSEGKDIAKVYQLYIPDTQDEKWMESRHKELIQNAEKVVWK